MDPNLQRDILQEELFVEAIEEPLPLDEFIRQNSLSVDVFYLEDSMLEGTIEKRSSLEDNSDIFDSQRPITPIHALDVACVKYSYLFRITNGFDPSVCLERDNFSEVFKGETASSKKLISVKRLKETPDFRSRMSLEVETLRNLKHPNILDIYGYSNDFPATPCIIYPWMVNGSLNLRLRCKPDDEKQLTAKQRLDIAYGVSKGICHIHRLQEGQNVMIHRDIKTSNILLDQNLQPKVAGFDLLMLAAPGEEEYETVINIAMGTPAYMSPEAIRGDCSAKWDVWSFGMVLLELLTSLPVICRERDDPDILSHVQTVVGDNGDEALKNILDSCWHNDNMVQSANLIYKLAHARCFVTSKYNRASMEEVVENIGEIVGNN